ncbi:TonB-dependent receptor plug domain-containing protein [Cohaesibacter haloalkalitolerans]|uniref:TonB-dependent receptor plug domain-containing protein n=1 Tax=Cohaesibacter haloalkalitolerans TaxID=1162980 RepID=UPI000E65E769|nr:TonB-dependent receptor [Cohaesibacter haloalkalitolerans]
MSGKVGVASLVALGMIGSVSATGAYAEDLDLGEVVISAGLNPVDEEKVGRSYTVVTSQELESRHVNSVAEALRLVPGVSVGRSGSTGALTEVRIRGGESRHVLVLIDGIEASAIALGAYDFSSLETVGIDRIEVLRGPQSALYGAHAMSGVINIITKKGERNSKPKFTVKQEVGTELSSLTSAEVRGGQERFDYAFSGAFHYTDGINTALTGSEKDANRNITLNGKVNADLTDDLKVDASLRYVDKNSDADAYTTAPSDDPYLYANTQEFFGSLGLTHSLWDGHFVQKARARYSSSTQRGLDYASWTNSYDKYGSDSDKLSLDYQGTVFFDTPSLANAKHSLTGAVSWQTESYTDPYSTDPERKRDTTGLAFDYTGEFWDNLFLGAGARYDIFEDFKDTATYNVNAAYVFEGTGTRLHSSVGTGTAIPSYYQTYNAVYGNANLSPEKTFGWDAGIEQSLFNDRFKVDVTYFNQRLTDEIIFSSVTYKYANETGVSKRQGVEISASAKLTDNLTVDASYTYTDSKTPSGAQESRRPKHSGTLKLSQAFLDGKAHAFVDSSIFADRTDTYVALDDYILVNVGADYQINDKIQVYGRIQNLFDENYQEVAGYNTAGITGYVGLKADF